APRRSGSEVRRNVMLATYPPGGLGSDTWVFADEYESRNPGALALYQQHSTLRQCFCRNAVQVACLEIDVGAGLFDIMPRTLDKLHVMFGFRFHRACFFHERVFPAAKILTSLHRASPAAPAWSWLSPLEYVGALGAVTETLRRPEEHDMGRLVGGDMDRPGQSLLM